MLAGLLGAAFFVASLIHVPIGFSSAHLILNGLLGVVLGWAAFHQEELRENWQLAVAKQELFAIEPLR